MLVDGTINGSGPFTLLIDTGARTSLVDPDVADTLGIAKTASEIRTGAGGAVEVDLGQATIGVERAVVTTEVAMTAEIKRVAVAIGAAIHGVIGQNFLREYTVTIDFPRREMTFAPHGVPFTLAGTKPLVTVGVRVNERGPFRLVIDTGASATVISEDLAAALKLESSTGGVAIGAGGAAALRIARLRSVSIENVAEKRDLLVGVASFLPAISAQIGSPIDGIVGHDFLRDDRLTFDYSASRLRFE